MNNEIILRSVYGKVNQTYYINPCPNPKTGKLPDCVRPVNSNGDMILSEDDIAQMSRGIKHFVAADHVFEIIDGTVFNLDDIVDKAHWDAIKFCNWIAKDRDERDVNGELVIDGGVKRYGVADLYVERPGEIAKVKVSRRQLITRACNYIFDESIEEQKKKCKVLGRDLRNAMPADITDYLIDIAEKNPKKIISLYEEEGWKMQLFIMDAVERGVIRKSEGIYKYDDKMLGGSVEATATFLSDPRFRKILESIKMETYPNLLPKNIYEELEQSVHKGIPHFDNENDKVKEQAPEPTAEAKTKAEKLLPKK